MNTIAFLNHHSHFQTIRIATLLLLVLDWSSLAFCGQIHNAIHAGDLQKVNTLLLKDPKLVSSKDKDGSTPLHLAAMNGHKDVAELLLAKGADVNLREEHGATALFWAAGRGHKDVAELLLANKAQVNIPDLSGRTPLGAAVQSGRRDIVILLRQHGGSE